MKRHIPRLGLRSLTARLVAGVVVLVFLLVVAIGGATYYSLRSFLFARLDQQVGDVADGNARSFAQCLAMLRCEVGGSGGYQAPQDEWVTVLSSGTATRFGVNAGQGVRVLLLTSSQQHAVTSEPNSSRTLRTRDGFHLRVSARRLDVNGATYTVVSGLSTRDLGNTLSRLVAVELIIGTAATAVALGATAWGVRRSLRNLYQVTGTAREVAAELSPSGAGLDRRVHVAEDGTEVGLLAESMNTLLSTVETQFAARLQSEQRMRQFLADASHELRTPLTSIRGYAELARLQRAAARNGAGATYGAAGGVDGGANGADGAADNLDRIEAEGTRMSRLVDDLLLLARGEDGSDSVRADEPVDLAGVLEDAVETTRVAFPDRPIGLEVDDLPAVLGDRDQLLRAVRNLVTNAAVHTEAGRPIAVRGRRDAGDVVVTVADGGPGLPPDQAAHVFERFWRADKARTRARGGTGLGMSIVAAIAGGHGGTVGFDSDVATGSTVTLRLPVAPALLDA